MKKAEKPRPKIAIRFWLASKKLTRQGLNKVGLTLNWPMKKRKRQKKVRELIAKIGWILFEALVVFFMNYFLLKMVS